MLYELLHPHFNIFTYLTFRTAGAVVTAALIMFVFGKPMIGWLRVRQGKGQPIRTEGPESHFKKAGTPTMGGVLILLGIAISTLLWFDWTNRFVWIVLVVTLGFGAIGWTDDWRKVVNKDPEGMSSKEKFFWQTLIGLVAMRKTLFPWKYLMVLELQEWLRKARLV